jgi:predicted lactoylglutathione lyase
MTPGYASKQQEDTAMRVIFVNLSARDLRVSRTFFAAPGIMFNPGLSGDRAGCLVVDGNAFVVLLAEERLLDFINGEISHARRTTEVLTCLPAGCG